MSYTALPNVSTGELATAALQNTLLGNIAELRQGGIALASGAALDFLYNLSATQVGRKAVSGALKYARTNSAGTDWEIVDAPGDAPTYGRYATTFEASGRFTNTAYGSGSAPSYGISGVQFSVPAAGGGAGSGNDWLFNPTGIDPEPGFGFTVVGIPVDTKGTDGRFFAGIVASTPARPGFAASAAYTVRHFGFRISWDSSGAATLYGTQSDGTTNTSTSLATIAENDHLVMQAVINAAGDGVTYRYWLNGVMAAETTVTANFPTGSNYNSRLAIGLENNTIATADTATIFGAEIFYGS